MKVFRSFSIPKKFNDSVIAIGNFDGLHLGHQEVINEAQKISLKFKKKVGVMTFEPHPKSFFQKKYEFFRLTPFRMKYELLKKKKLDFMLNIKFDKNFMSISPLDFIEKILLEDLKASHIVTGFDFVFGNKQAGNVDDARLWALFQQRQERSAHRDNGVEVDGHEPVEVLCADLIKIAAQSNASIVDQDFDVTVFRNNRCGQCGYGGAVGDIQRVFADAYTQCPRLRSGFCQRVGVEVRQSQITTGTRQGVG